MSRYLARARLQINIMKYLKAINELFVFTKARNRRSHTHTLHDEGR